MNYILLEEYEKIYQVLSSNINDLKNKSILITGANGLIGSYLVEFLQYLNLTLDYNIKIYLMSRSLQKLRKRFKNQSSLFFIEQDLNQQITINQTFDYIIHAASNAHPIAFSTDPVGTMKTNLIGTINLLEMSKNSNTKFLYLSTGEIYGNNVDKAFNENCIGLVNSTDVRSCYPESKRAAETLCIAYANQYNINTNIARLCYIYGATITDDNSRADAQFLRKVINKENIILKSLGEQKRTYCYVADAVSALLFILLNAKSKDVYNIANPNSIVSVKQYAELLARIGNVNIEYDTPSENEKKGYSKPADSILDATKLINMGWQPLYDIQEGLQHTFLIKKEACCV